MRTLAKHTILNVDLKDPTRHRSALEIKLYPLCNDIPGAKRNDIPDARCYTYTNMELLIKNKEHNFNGTWTTCPLDVKKRLNITITWPRSVVGITNGQDSRRTMSRRRGIAQIVLPSHIIGIAPTRRRDKTLTSASITSSRTRTVPEAHGRPRSTRTLPGKQSMVGERRPTTSFLVHYIN